MENWIWSLSKLLWKPGQVMSKKQHPLLRKGRKGLQPVAESLLKADLLKPCMSPYNSPILPVMKSDGTCRIDAGPKNNRDY